MFFLVLVLGLFKLGASADQSNAPLQPSYVRKEIPLPNTYISYAPLQQVRFPDNFFHNVNVPYSVKRSTFRGIQYAPLQGVYQYLLGPSKPTNTPGSSTASITTTVPQRIISEQVRIEPIFQTDRAPCSQTGQCFNSGHNIEVMSSVSRSPGHNAVYRNYPSPTLGNKSHKMGKPPQAEKYIHENIIKSVGHKISALKIINYLKPHGGHHSNEFPVNTITTQTSSTAAPKIIKNTRPIIDSNTQQVINPNLVDGEDNLMSSKPKRQHYSPYGKFHRLHLNIARVYSPGEVQPKSPVLANTYSVNLETEGATHLKLPAYMSPLFHATPERKTLLLQQQDIK